MREKTTVSRRVIMAKVKSRPNQRHQDSTPTRPYNPQPKIVPVLFDRSSLPRAPVLIPGPWWGDWKVIMLAISMVLMLLGAIYFATRGSANPPRTLPRAAQQDVLKPPPEINIRPMGFASSRSSATGGMRQANAGASAGGAGLVSGSSGDGLTGAVSKQQSAAGLASASDELNLAALEKSKPLILPSDIAGNCNIGKNGMGDLSRCLVANGARVDR